MSGLSAGHVGIAGEVRFVVKRDDGSVKEDTGFKKNLILNQGLEFFGGNHGYFMFDKCVIGSGNSTPAATQTQLDAFLMIRSGVELNREYDYVPDGSGIYKTNRIQKYVFTGLNNVNVGEVGLASLGSSSSNYYLCTRALIKDSSGTPTTITVLLGETLEIYYKVWQVFSTTDTNYVVNMLDGKGGTVPYNVKVRLAGVGTGRFRGLMAVLSSGYGGATSTHTGDLGVITGLPTGQIFSASINNPRAYIPLSFKRVLDYPFAPTESNGSIRTVVFPSSMGVYQFRFGSVANDSPIRKSELQSLSFPIEFSWGRYEGEL